MPVEFHARPTTTLRLVVAGVLGASSAATVGAGWELAAGRTRAWEIGLMLLLYLLAGVGVTVGFHRLLAHRAFKAGAAVRGVLAALGCMALQGPPIQWVATHRRHHRFADREGDPHSPRCRGGRRPRHRLAGFWHAHIGWAFDGPAADTTRYCKDLFRDPAVTAVNRRYGLWALAGLMLPAGIGWLFEPSVAGVAKGLLWGGGVRVFLLFNAICLVNSVTHMFGRRDFPTADHSTNNAWLALPTLGEAWHNNHHACPQAACFGRGRWQLDPGGWVVRALEAAGLATDVHPGVDRPGD